MFTLVATVFFAGCGIPGLKPDAPPMSTAQPIIAAVSTFEKKNGHLPAKLEELVPDYLPAIPQPNWGTNHWIYVPADNPSYGYTLKIKYWEKGYETAFYYNYKDDWWLDQ